ARALAAIEEAGAAGAQVLAAAALGEAAALRDRALTRRRQTDWQACFELARAARQAADKALKTARAARHLPAEALLSDRTGTVESRMPGDLVWRDAPLRSKLTEGEKVRTLSSSLAAILFPDHSSLRLEENSQAVIRSLRRDALSQRRESKVELIGGDLEALLKGNPRRRPLELAIPGVTVRSESKNFWASRRQGKVRLANYEHGQIELSAAGGTVVLERNQGAVVSGGRVSAARRLLPAPQLPGSAAPAIAYQGVIELTWEPVAGASRYWIRIGAGSSAIQPTTLSRMDLTLPRFSPQGLGSGLYTWRVAAIDVDGLPGPPSAVATFQVVHDQTPPFLVVESPRRDAVLTQAAAVLVGETEDAAVLTAGDQPVTVGPGGRFRFEHPLAPGPNPIRLQAVDAAGNTTRWVHTVTRLEPGEVGIRYHDALPRRAPGHFLSRRRELVLAGTTAPGSTVTVEAAGCVAGADGRFRLRLTARGAAEPYLLRVVSPAGTVRDERLVVELDDQPPRLALDRPPPRATAAPVLRLSGRVQGALSLAINGVEAAIDGERFELVHELSPGSNPIRLTARDAAGNTTRIGCRVLLDRAPPELVAHRIRALPGTVRVRVAARDDAGLRRAAAFTVELGGVEHRGLLELDRSRDLYEGILRLPATPRLIRVLLEDVLGNGKEYRLAKP
ncbi:MAG: FecR domain-containing protein, partial [bacterium]|nr:FecR domain-containing protein [bacterium]